MDKTTMLTIWLVVGMALTLLATIIANRGDILRDRQDLDVEPLTIWQVLLLPVSVFFWPYALWQFGWAVRYWYIESNRLEKDEPELEQV